MDGTLIERTEYRPAGNRHGIEAWVRPVVAQLSGIDLELPALTAAGYPAETRRERLVEVLGDTLVGYSDLVGRVRADLGGDRRKRAMQVVDAGVSGRQRAALEIGLTGTVPAGPASMADIEMRAYEAAHSVSMPLL